LSWPAYAGHPGEPGECFDDRKEIAGDMIFNTGKRVNWVARTEFTLRPRFARTGVAGHDKEWAS
jgi:hypothetical protein